MKKILYRIALLVLILCVSATSFATDYPQDEFSHDEFLGRVLLGEKYDAKKDDPNLFMLQLASYLAIDQFNNNNNSKKAGDQEKLEKLRIQFGVPGLPASIDEINPTAEQTQLSGKNHRTYTHRGWLFPYKNHFRGDLARSETRSRILRNTVIKIFDFKLKPSLEPITWIGSLFHVSYDDERCEGVCKLIYYVHVLGDCYEDDTYKKANGSSNGFKIPLGRAHPGNTIEESDLIGELIQVMPVVFPKQQSTWRYMSFMRELGIRAQEIRALYRKTGEINSQERYEEYHKQVKKLMDVLETYLPKLLKNEPFFTKVFY